MCMQCSSPMMQMSAMPSVAPGCPCCGMSTMSMMPMGGGMSMMPMAGGMFPTIVPEEFQKQQLQFQHQQLSQMKANIKAMAESIEKSMAEIEVELKKLESTKTKKGA